MPFDLTKLPLVSLSGCGMMFCRVPTAYTDIMGVSVHCSPKRSVTKVTGKFSLPVVRLDRANVLSGL